VILTTEQDRELSLAKNKSAKFRDKARTHKRSAEAPAIHEKRADEGHHKRLISLDAFRGLTILGMLLVNNISLDTSTPKNLMHAGWNQGVNLADLVFPWFLFIVGVAIPYSYASHKRKGRSTWQYFGKAFWRALTLVALGCLIDSSLAKKPIFDLSVLQLIGLAYLIAALLSWTATRYKLAVAAVLLVGHWALIEFFPVPGVGKGLVAESANAIKYINDTYLRVYHLNGLLSLAPTAALALIGSCFGDILRRDNLGQWRKAAYIIAAGLVIAGLGLLWDKNLPFNKTIWSSSYILFTGGLAAIGLGAFYVLIDISGRPFWAFPLVVLGMNAIVAYVAPILVKAYILQVWRWRLPNGHDIPLQQAFLNYCIALAGRSGGGWMYTVAYIVFWWLVLFFLYRKKVFLRV
jgi:predicted acyltransferase